MPRVLWLVSAALLSLPALSSGLMALSSACFLAEFLTTERWRPLSAITVAPSVRPLMVTVRARPVPADLYVRPSFVKAPGLVLVHGLSPEGKDDPRLQRAAMLLARDGWAVAVPTIEGLTVLRLRPEDSLAVVATIRALAQAGHGPVAILGVSVGAGPALLAAADPSVSSSISAVLALGGYASTVELLRYTLTGAYRFETHRGRRPIDDAAIAAFTRANPELVDAPGRRLINNRDPELVDQLVALLPEPTRHLLDSLSTQTLVDRLKAPLFLVHGRDDPAVPYTETMRLERSVRAAGLHVKAVIVGSLGHVEPENRAGPRDLTRLWAAFYAFEVTGKLAR